ncbi:MAG: hypothetical protein K8T89_00870 [Planctomycetes bacterium]|nr:hypothetical protein [Planctomycetota bacterium]
MADEIGPEVETVSTGPRLVKRWLDQLELTLRNEAELSGLLGHGTMIGSAREFFVARVLRSILPPSVHIGSGRIINSTGISKQIDIILYDPKCPLMEIQPGQGLYFIEGVIATIEVKSLLTKEKLIQALDNCGSVARLMPSVSSFEPLDRLGNELFRKNVLPKECLQDQVRWKISPRNYVFSFTTRMGFDAIKNTVNEWYTENGSLTTAYYSMLPAVFATQGFIGLANDDWIPIHPGEDVLETMKKEHGVDSRVVMGLWPTQRQFGWLAIRIMHDVNVRLGLSHAQHQVPFFVDKYLSAQDYFEEDLMGKTGWFIIWSRKSYTEALAAKLGERNEAGSHSENLT